MSSVELRQIAKAYGAFEAVRNLDLKIEDGEFFNDVLGIDFIASEKCMQDIIGWCIVDGGLEKK